LRVELYRLPQVFASQFHINIVGGIIQPCPVNITVGLRLQVRNLECDIWVFKNFLKDRQESYFPSGFDYILKLSVMKPHVDYRLCNVGCRVFLTQSYKKLVIFTPPHTFVKTPLFHQNKHVSL